MTKLNKKVAAFVLVGAVALIWAGAFLALVLFHPNIAQWTVIVTTCALLSEAALWAGVALLGLTALDKFRIWHRLRRKN